MFAESVNTIYKSGVKVRSRPTVNPVVFEITIEVGRRISGESRLYLWNLFQKWSIVNGCVLQGKVEGKRTDELVISLIVKRLSGMSQKNHPMEVEEEDERQTRRRPR